MVLKCNQEQFKALHRLFAVVMAEQPAGIVDSLLKDLLQPIYNKLNTRVNSYMNGKRGWNLSLTPLQAKTYYVFFVDMDLSPNWLYEHIIIQTHLKEINRVLTQNQ